MMRGRANRERKNENAERGLLHIKRGIKEIEIGKGKKQCGITSLRGNDRARIGSNLRFL